MNQPIEQRVCAIENRLRQVEDQVTDWQSIMSDSLYKIGIVEGLASSLQRDQVPPDGFTYLSDFCAQHFVPFQAAEELFPHAIRGQKIKSGRRLVPMIGPKGRHD